MIKQSKRWYASIVPSIIIFFSVSIAFAQTPAPTPTESSTTFQGQKMIEEGLPGTLSSKYGSGGGVLQNFIGPLMTGELLFTVSNSQSFSVGLSCPSSKNFMTMTILPSNSGDIQTLLVNQDLNLNGIHDYQFSLPAGIRVSGACANGIISCDAGTWQNCKGYQWVAEPDGRVGIQAIARESLGGCFCINNSCGQNLTMKLLDIILSSLGGGAVGVIQAKKPDFAVSRVGIKDTSINYYAQSVGSCENVVSKAPFSGLFSAGPGAIDDASQQEMAVQAQDTQSMYSLLANSQFAQGKSSALMYCSKKRVNQIVTLSESATYVWQPWLDIRMYCWWGRDSVNYCTTTVEVDSNRDGVYDKTDTIPEGAYWTANQSITMHQNKVNTYVATYQQQHNIAVTDMRMQANSEYYRFQDGGGKGMHNDSTWYNRIMEAKSPPICPTDYTFITMDGMCYKDVFEQSTVSTCNQLEMNAECKLKQETVDGVYVLKNFAPTGLKALPTCIEHIGKLQTIPDCQPWWEIHRIYVCPSAGPDMSGILNRVGNIHNTISYDGSSVTYEDKRKDDNGEWITESRAFDLINMTGNDNSCTMACKTKKLMINTEISTTASAAEHLTTTDTYVTTVKQCDQNNQCAVVEGEEIIDGCKCINSFAGAAVMGSLLDEASKNMICSDGVMQ